MTGAGQKPCPCMSGPAPACLVPGPCVLTRALCRSRKAQPAAQGAAAQPAAQARHAPDAQAPPGVVGGHAAHAGHAEHGLAHALQALGAEMEQVSPLAAAAGRAS